jgi:hypothetical protein
MDGMSPSDARMYDYLLGGSHNFTVDRLEGNDRATAILADMRGPTGVLNHQKTQQLLDFDAPIGLLMVAVLHYVADSNSPMQMLATAQWRPRSAGDVGDGSTGDPVLAGVAVTR